MYPGRRSKKETVFIWENPKELGDEEAESPETSSSTRNEEILWFEMVRRREEKRRYHEI